MSTLTRQAATSEPVPAFKTTDCLAKVPGAKSSIDLSKYVPSPAMMENAKNLYKIELTELDCSFGMVKRRDTKTLKQIVRQQPKLHHSDVTLLFAIRQPACGGCREHALQLADFAARDRRMAVIGTVKETGINDKAILGFFQEYFRGNTLFLDEKWQVFKAMGTSRMSLRQLIVGFFKAQRRFRQKGIKNAGKMDRSDNFLKGGVILFDKSARMRFYIEVQDFSELSVEVLEAAVAETRRLYLESKSDTTNSTDQGDLTESNRMDHSESNQE